MPLKGELAPKAELSVQCKLQADVIQNPATRKALVSLVSARLWIRNVHLITAVHVRLLVIHGLHGRFVLSAWGFGARSHRR